MTSEHSCREPEVGLKCCISNFSKSVQYIVQWLHDAGIEALAWARKLCLRLRLNGFSCFFFFFIIKYPESRWTTARRRKRECWPCCVADVDGLVAVAVGSTGPYRTDHHVATVRELALCERSTMTVHCHSAETDSPTRSSLPGSCRTSVGCLATEHTSTD